MEDSCREAALVVWLACAPPALAWDRDAAQDYAHNYWSPSNSNYPTFSNDCANYVSQCLHAQVARENGEPDGYGGVGPSAPGGPGIDMWYVPANYGWYCCYYANNWWYGVGAGSHAWTVAKDFHSMFRDNSHFNGYRVLIGAYDFHYGDSTWPDHGRYRDAIWHSSVISYDETWWPDGGTFNAGHVAFVVHHDPLRSEWPGCSDMDPGNLVNEHTTNRWHVFWTKADVYRYDPDHRDNWVIAAWRVDDSCP